MGDGSSGPYNGSVGSARDSATSKESAEQTTFAAALRIQVFSLIKENDGCTRGELFDLLDEKYQQSTLSARIRELCLTGHIKDSGTVRFYSRTGRNHIVWIESIAPRSICWDGKQWVDQ